MRFRRRSRLGSVETLESRTVLSAVSLVSNVLAQREIWSPEAVDVGDFDGDQDMDIAVATHDEMLVWFENSDGLGTFDRKHMVSADNHHAMNVADVDGDGRDDLVAAGDELHWYRNLGPDNFEKLHVGSGVDGFTLYDAGQDGDLDLLAHKFDGGSYAVTWREYNASDRAFTNPTQLLTTDRPIGSLAFVDLDDDGQDELLVEADDVLYSLQSKPDAEIPFGDVEIVWQGPNTGFGIRDLDTHTSPGDQAAKMAFLVGDGTLRIYRSSASDDGTLDSTTLDVRESAWDYVRFNDVDLDGDVDLWLTNEVEEIRTGWVENLGAEGWSEVRDLGIQSLVDLEDGIMSRRGADFNLDGVIDYVWSTDEEEVMAWQETSTDFPEIRFVPQEPNDGRHETFVDLDGDGDLDILAPSLPVGWYENLDGRGDYGTFRPLLDTRYSVEFVDATDVDRDGDLDLVTSTGPALSWFENTGQFEFGAPRALLEQSELHSSPPYELVYGENRQLESIVAIKEVGSRRRQLGWTLMDDDGVPGEFSGLRELPGNLGGLRIQELLAADLNGDSQQDLITMGWYDERTSAEVTVYLRQGDQLREASKHTTNGLWFQLDTGDVNADGLPDIAIYDQSDELLWLVNTGDGKFATEEMRVRVAASHDGVYSVGIADLDQDGDSDVVLENVDYWLENDGVGNYTRRVHGFIPASIGDVGDVNADGRPDFLLDRNRGLRWVDNRMVGDIDRDGRFGSTDLIAAFQAGAYEAELAASFDQGDWDRDGRFTSSDLVFAMSVNPYLSG